MEPTICNTTSLCVEVEALYIANEAKELSFEKINAWLREINVRISPEVAFLISKYSLNFEHGLFIVVESRKLPQDFMDKKLTNLYMFCHCIRYRDLSER